MVVALTLAVRPKKAKNNRKLKKKSISRASNPGTGRSMSRRYLAFEKQFHDDDSDNDSENADDVENNAENALNSQEIGKVLPQTDDLAWIHLINWLDEDSDVHICQYIISSFKKYKSKSLKHILSPLKLKKVQRNLEDGMKKVLDVAENLVPQKIKQFYMYIEDENGDPSECVLLDETANDGTIEKNWYLLVLFHQATDSFLHLITSEQDLFVETKKPWARKLQNYIKYVLGMAYPVIYSYTLTMIMIEYMFRAVCMKSVAEKVKKHRQDWEEVFDDTWVLNFVQWCSNVWFFVALLTYIISYFGAGFVNWDACFCNPDHTWPDDWKAKVVNEGWHPNRDSHVKPNYQCNTQLLDSIDWLKCQNSTTDYTQTITQCTGNYNDNHKLGETKYPHKLLANEFWTEKEWVASPNKEILADIPQYMNAFESSHYRQCEFYDFMFNLRTASNKSDYMSFYNNHNNLNKQYSEINPYIGTPNDAMDAIFMSFYWMFDDTKKDHGIIGNEVVQIVLLAYMAIFIVCKMFNEFVTYLDVNCCWSKYAVDKVNLIDVVHIISVVGYVVCEYFRIFSDIDTFASTSFANYEIAARLFEIFAILTTILIILSLFPKINMYTCEINSVIDMIFYGIRYLIVLTLLFTGFWFIGGNLYRRAKENNRNRSIMNGDFNNEKVMSDDLPFTSVDTLSSLLKAPFGIMTVPGEVYSYSTENRNDPNFDHANITSISAFWVIFFVLVVLIGFNGMVAFMTANLKIGNFEEQLDEKLMPSNIMRYNMCKLQPKYQYWPIPFNIPLMIHEFSKYMISCFEKKEQIEENELPKLQQPMPDATKQVMTDCVVECIIAHTGIDFESSTGASLLAIVTEIVGEGSKHPAKDSAYLKYLVEKYAPAPPSDEKSERVKYLETLLTSKDIHFE